MTTATPIRPIDFATFVSSWVADSDDPAKEHFSKALDKSDPKDERVQRIRRRRYRIFVVDDNDIFRQSLVFNLRRAYGALVEEAATASNALERVGNGSRFDLILMDVSMPGIDGTEACSTMRSRGIACQIVLMSAHAENKVKAQDIDVPFLQKPLDKNALEKLLLTCEGPQPHE